MGLLLNGWVVFILWLGGLLPGTDGDVFFAVQRLAFGAVGASMVAHGCQFTDVRLFHFWKRLTNGRALWLRNNGSTLVSQLVDTAAVVLISHYAGHVLPVNLEERLMPQLLGFIASGYLFKVLAALLIQGLSMSSIGCASGRRSPGRGRKSAALSQLPHTVRAILPFHHFESGNWAPAAVVAPLRR